MAARDTSLLHSGGPRAAWRHWEGVSQGVSAALFRYDLHGTESVLSCRRTARDATIASAPPPPPPPGFANATHADARLWALALRATGRSGSVAVMEGLIGYSDWQHSTARLGWRVFSETRRPPRPTTPRMQTSRVKLRRESALPARPRRACRALLRAAVGCSRLDRRIVVRNRKWPQRGASGGSQN